MKKDYSLPKLNDSLNKNNGVQRSMFVIRKTPDALTRDRLAKKIENSLHIGDVERRN
jgi:hypothetical protein